MSLSVLNGDARPTCHCCQHFAESIGPIPEQTNAASASLIGGGKRPNVFRKPAAALSSFRQVVVGGVGERNNLRSRGIFSVDLAALKLFRLPLDGYSLQFRAEAINLTNGVRFNADARETLSHTFTGSFGSYARALIPPRVLQFGRRYEFLARAFRMVRGGTPPVWPTSFPPGSARDFAQAPRSSRRGAS